MVKREGNVLVLGHGERAFLSVIRSLGRGGLNVHVAMCPPDDLALQSRYVVQRHEVPDYHTDNRAWLEAMERVLTSTPFQLVVPCEDQAVIPLQAHQQRLRALAPLYTLGERAYEVAFSKIQSYRLAEQLEIPQPRSAILRDGESVERISDFSLPLVIKPPSSFTSHDLGAKRGVVRCRTERQVAEQLKHLPAWGEALVQENFIGTGVGVELLAHEGNVLVAFQHVRVHEPLEGGGSSYRRSAPLDPRLLAASKAIMQALGYTGVAMVEFKLHFETGQWVFVEINGRFWGSLPLAIAAGVDFPLYLYDLLVDGRREFPQAYRTPLYCRNVSSDQRWLRSNFRADKRDPLLATRPLHRVAAEAWNVLTLRERWDTLVADDPRPGLTDVAGIVGDAGRKLTRSVRHAVDALPWVRGWRRGRALERARKAQSILFVCKGNICRSPYAEQYARKRLPPEIRVRSCGYYPKSGRPAPEVAQGVAQQYGIDLSAHQSQVLSEELIREADVIFVFDEQNRETVLRQFPAAAERLFGLGLLCSRPPYHVADPYGSSAGGFQAAYDQIGDALDTLVAGFTSGSKGLAVSTQELRRGAV